MIQEQSIKGKNNRTEEEQKKRFYIMSGILFITMALMFGLIMYFLGDKKEEESINQTFSVNDSEKKEINSVVNEFINVSGTWGLRESAINDNNINEVMHNLNIDSNMKKSYWTDRSEVYQQVQKNYLSPMGPLNYPPELYGNWKDFTAMKNNSSFSTKSENAVVNPEGIYYNINGTDYKIVDSTITFTTNAKKYMASADDVSWDGTYFVLGKDFKDTAIVSSIYIPNKGWKVYDIKNQKYPFLLSVWKNPVDYQEYQRDFVKIKEIKGSKK